MKYWVRWTVTFLSAVTIGVLAIPFFRVYPKGIHEFALQLDEWQRQLGILVICVIVAHLLVKRYPPKPKQLRHLCTHPPLWLACALGVATTAWIDLVFHLTPGTYIASRAEWIGYAGVAIVIVLLFRIASGGAGETSDEGHRHPPVVSQDLGKMEWPVLEEWLDNEQPAELDLLGSYAVAKSLAEMLVKRKYAIGLVGPFGSGKTSIVEWVKAEAAASPLIFSRRSCWGFESSATAIRVILSSGLDAVAQYIDVTHVTSLPEDYQDTFGAGGEWLRKLSTLVFAKRTPYEQFKELSFLLEKINMRLVFVIEDLDRNESAAFDVQEVLSLLHQLKSQEYDRISFVLSGGVGKEKRIDFAKLCDHLEYVRLVSVQQASSLISNLRKRCFDQDKFSHVDFEQSGHLWEHPDWAIVLDRGRMAPVEAASRLLNTPRTVKAVLRRTYRNWKLLHGEVDWDQLFAINVLRDAAPEALDFLLQNWARFHDNPPQHIQDGSQLDIRRNRLEGEWRRSVDNVEWDENAARALMEFLLPSSRVWMGEAGFDQGTRKQGVHQEKYWRRAINERLDTDEVRDQQVIRDQMEWRRNPSSESRLVQNICRSENYALAWEVLAGRVAINGLEAVLQLSGQLITAAVEIDGACTSRQSQGVNSAMLYAIRYGRTEDGPLQWIESRIGEAVGASLALTRDLWMGLVLNGNGFIQTNEIPRVRRHLVKVMREQFANWEQLSAIMCDGRRYQLSPLVCETGEAEGANVEEEDWTWLGRVLLEGIRHGSVAITLETCSVIAARNQGVRNSPATINLSRLQGLFQEQSAEVLDAISEMSQKADGVDADLMVEIVASGRAALAQADDESLADVQER